MATDEQRDDLRADIGDPGGQDTEVFSDVEIDRIWVRAEGSYPGNETLIGLQARVLAITQLLASSAKLVTYKQNQSSENQSDIFKNLKALRTVFIDERETIEAYGQSAARLGYMRRLPTRSKEVPGS